MKNLIKQILREETSELSDAEKNAAYKLMNMLTKRYHWYHDTPEHPFEYSPGSIWLINPETKEWMLDLKISGHLFYYHKIFDNFSKYLNMGKSDFKSFIKLWVEDVLKREVSSTHIQQGDVYELVEDALNNGKQLK